MRAIIQVVASMFQAFVVKELIIRMISSSKEGLIDL
jgi:hypothetical protein